MRRPRYPLYVFAASIVISYLLLPQGIMTGFYSLLSATFMVVFSLSVTCIVRNSVEQARTANHSHSGISLAAAVLGISAFHACGVSVCGYGLGFLMLSAALPAVALGAFSAYGVVIITISIAVQLIVMYRMRCFRASVSRFLRRR